MKHHRNLLLEWFRVPEPSKPPPMPKPSAAPPPPAPAAPVAVPAPAPVQLALMLRPRTFGEFLRAVREADRLTVEEVATLLEVSPAAVLSWEADKQIPIAAHYDHLLVIFPALIAEGVPVPPCRDIPKPPGRTAETSPRSSAAPPARPEAASVPSSAPAREAVHEPPAASGGRALIAFGVSLGRAVTHLGRKEARAAVLALLRDGDAAGLSAAAISDAIEAEVGR